MVILLQAAAREADTPDEGTSMLEQMASYLESNVSPEEVEEMAQEQPPEAEEIQKITEPAEEAMPPEGAGLMARGE